MKCDVAARVCPLLMPVFWSVVKDGQVRLEEREDRFVFIILSADSWLKRRSRGGDEAFTRQGVIVGRGKGIGRNM